MQDMMDIGSMEGEMIIIGKMMEKGKEGEGDEKGEERKKWKYIQKKIMT